MLSFTRRYLLRTAPLRLAGGVFVVAALEGLGALPAFAAPSKVRVTSKGPSFTATATVVPGGILSLTDPTFTPGKTALHYRTVTLTNPGGHGAANYTFTLTATGFQGALYLYQNPFVPNSSPPPNLWAFQKTGSPVTISTPLTANYQSTFVLVITSTSPTALGAYNLSISGPSVLTLVAPPVKLAKR